MTWTHDELVSDLAGQLKAPDVMTWCDLQLGASGSVRPDVYLMTKSFRHPYCIAYECKISRSDFLADVTSGKWANYLKYAYGVIFAVPAGLIDKKELPDKCGLIVRHEERWRLAKRPIIEVHPIPENAWRKLLIDGLQREGPIARARHWSTWDATSKFNKKYGRVAAQWIHDATSVSDTVERCRRECDIMRDTAAKQIESMRGQALVSMPIMWAELLGILGLPNESDRHTISHAIHELKKIKHNDAFYSAARTVDTIEHLVNQLHDYFNPPSAKGES
jgi:hypothetical protein